MQVAGRRQEIVERLFGINSGFHGVPLDFQLLLAQRERFSRGYQDLPGNKVLSGYHFRYGVFHLIILEGRFGLLVVLCSFP